MRLGWGLLLLTLSSGSAMGADSQPHTLGVGVGTTGFVLDYRLPLQGQLALRLAYHRGHVQWDQEKGDIDYDGKLDMNAFAAMIDWHPFASAFRLSAGGFSALPELELRSSGRDDYRIGSSTYTADLDMQGEVTVGSAAPYLGIGWGGHRRQAGWSVSADLGVLFGEAPNVKLDVRGRACDSTLLTCDPNGPRGFDVNGSSPEARQFQRDKEQEIKEVEDELRDYRFWPVLMLGLHYSF